MRIDVRIGFGPRPAREHTTGSIPEPTLVRSKWGLLSSRLIFTSALHASVHCMIAIGLHDHFDLDSDALRPLEAGSEPVLIGAAEAESRFSERFCQGS